MSLSQDCQKQLVAIVIKKNNIHLPDLDLDF